MDFSVIISFKENIKQFYFINFFILRSHYLFESCERKKYVSKLKGRRNGRKPLPHNGYFSFFRYLLTFPRSIQGRIMINLFLSRSFFLVYENSLRHDGFCFLSSLLFSYDHLGRFSQHTLFNYFFLSLDV